MKLVHCVLPICALLLISSCSTSRKSGSFKAVVNLDTLSIFSDAETNKYRASNKRIFDIIHTKLDVSFTIPEQQMSGKETITLKPHFYNTDSLILDAKGMSILSVNRTESEGGNALKYTYDSLKLRIYLGKQYTSKDTLNVRIDYIANPSKLQVKGSEAIDDARGLYFINHDGKEKNKPQQIWTQGETESASCWFPTIDSPNQRMTQEIAITVDTSFVTISNGLLEYSVLNPNGTRTDFWKQSLPAAPYLSMMAVGHFSVVHDTWRDKEVNYYVDPKYAPYAKQIFGRTPEMLEFYSKLLGVDYPWEKFSQVVVHDFVSGAMENTSVVVHNEELQKTSRQLLDGNMEEYISHELFHHWFGDYVTCESWSNIPLNESFATYGEYLWNDYKNGREEADYYLQQDLAIYLRNAKKKQVDLIRFNYSDKEEMFDGFSYQKGGRVLHMLRKYVGDEAFFASLKLYLEKNKFTSVEIHDLRLAFEEVTGEDLNWFFNQWFLDKGHPELSIHYLYNDSAKKEIVTIRQNQDIEKFPLYGLPLEVDIYSKGKTVRRKITVSKLTEDFVFETDGKPDLVNVDAEKMLLGTKQDNHTTTEWKFQFYHAPLYLDKAEAINHLAKTSENDSIFQRLISDAMKDSFWGIRLLALEKINKEISGNPLVKAAIVSIAKTDKKSDVRALALSTLAKFCDDTLLYSVYRNAATDSSYAVVAEALAILADKDSVSAFQYAKKYEKDESGELLPEIGMIFSKSGTDDQMAFFVNHLNGTEDGNKYQSILNFSKFLMRCGYSNFETGLKLLDSIARNEKPWWVRVSAIQGLDELKGDLLSLEKETRKKSNKLTTGDSAKPVLEKKADQLNMNMESVKSVILAIRRDEKDKKVLKYFDKKE